MRIIDTKKQRDYYDVGQSLGQDQGVVYLRETTEIERHYGYSYDNGFTQYTVGFCGVLYPLFRASFWMGGKFETAWCYSLDDCDQFARKLDEAAQERYFGTDRDRPFARKHRSSGWDLYSPTTQASLKRYFVEHPTLSNIRTDAFRKHNAPIIVWTPKKMIINAILRPYDFVRVKDPYTAFQELQMFVGGVLLQPVNLIPPVPDEIMVEIKGFHPKESFRKPKSKNQ